MPAEMSEVVGIGTAVADYLSNRAIEIIPHFVGMVHTDFPPLYAS